MTLSDQVRVKRRFLRSVRIDTDLGEVNALEGFVCPTSFLEVLREMARHFRDSNQGAFTWTGPYGSGKSSLAVAFSALLSEHQEMREQAAEVFGQDVTESLRDSLHTEKERVEA